MKKKAKSVAGRNGQREVKTYAWKKTDHQAYSTCNRQRSGKKTARTENAFKK